MFLRIITIILLLGWRLYWEYMAKKAEQEKAKTKQPLSFIIVERYALSILGSVLIAQLFGLKLFANNLGSTGQFIGFILVIIGVVFSVLARITLSSNWTHAFEYQIKKRHQLISTGVYNYVRHPIYTGMILAATGAELVAESYIYIPTLLGMFFWAYYQGKVEEKLLQKHFGKNYLKYKDKSKMLIPFIF